jgi:hypothetical protein
MLRKAAIHSKIKVQSSKGLATLARSSSFQLAAAGFYYSGKDDDDNVKCYLCDKELDGWDPKDDPMFVIRYWDLMFRKEHQKHAGFCPLLNLSIEENRIKTFKTWDAKISQFSASDVLFPQLASDHSVCQGGLCTCPN